MKLTGALLVSGVLFVGLAIGGFVIVPEHRPRSYCLTTSVASSMKCSGKVHRTGWARNQYDAGRIASWVSLIAGVVLLVFGLSRLRWLVRRITPIVNWFTTFRLAVGLIVVALLGCATYALGWAQAWMPNVVVGALTVALTVTVIDRAVRRELHREAEERVQPHRDDVLRSLRDDFELMLSQVAFDYAEQPGATFQEVPAEPSAMLDLWKSAQPGNVEKDKPDWNPGVLYAGTRFAERLERHRRRDHDVIPLEVIRAIDRFQREVQGAEALAGPWLTKREYRPLAQEAERRVIAASREWLDVFNRHAPEPPTLAHPFREIAETVSRSLIDGRSAKASDPQA